MFFYFFATATFPTSFTTSSLEARCIVRIFSFPQNEVVDAISLLSVQWSTLISKLSTYNATVAISQQVLLLSRAEAGKHFVLPSES